MIGSPDIWLRYDLRAPGFGTPTAELCSTAIEQVAWAETRGFSTVQLSEHHGSADGYLPSPFVLGAAIASRTAQIRVHIGATILALHDPLRVAEDIVVLDNVSSGRVELTVGAGYVPSEFAMFGVRLADRAALVEEGIETVRDALSARPFEYRGRQCRVTPAPTQGGAVPIYVGGGIRTSARRAARLGDGFFPSNPSPDLAALYADECARLGRRVGRLIKVAGPLAIHVTHDPDRRWAELAPHFLHETNSYGRWAAEASAASAGAYSPFEEITDPGALAAQGSYRVLTPDSCVDLLTTLPKDSTVIINPLVAGIEPSLSWESLELIAAEVMPRLRP